MHLDGKSSQSLHLFFNRTIYTIFLDYTLADFLFMNKSVKISIFRIFYKTQFIWNFTCVIFMTLDTDLIIWNDLTSGALRHGKLNLWPLTAHIRLYSIIFWMDFCTYWLFSRSNFMRRIIWILFWLKYRFSSTSHLSPYIWFKFFALGIFLDRQNDLMYCQKTKQKRLLGIQFLWNKKSFLDHLKT